jgi:hypothetical protein
MGPSLCNNAAARYGSSDHEDLSRKSVSHGRQLVDLVGIGIAISLVYVSAVDKAPFLPVAVALLVFAGWLLLKAKSSWLQRLSCIWATAVGVVLVCVVYKTSITFAVPALVVLGAAISVGWRANRMQSRLARD